MLNNAVREGASTPEHSFKSLAEIPSGHLAFAVDRLDSNALTSSTVTVIVSSWSCTDTEVVKYQQSGNKQMLFLSLKVATPM
jgi:hypothetical protein